MKRLLPVLAIATILRFWGLGFGLPTTGARPDEGRLVGIAARFTLNHDLNPHFFSYPTLFPYAVGSVYAGWCAGAVVVRAYPSMSDCSERWFDNWIPLFLTARALSAVAGVGAVALVFFIGLRFHRLAGWLAASLLSVAFLHVRDSHFGVTDVAMTSMTLLALLLLLRAHERPSLWRFVVAGLVAGLATSTKYNALLLGVPAVLSQAFAWAPAGRGIEVRHTRLLLFATSAAVGFFAGTPFALFDRNEFLTHTQSESRHLLEWGRSVPLGIGWVYHAIVTLPQGVGWPLFVVGVAGIVWALAAQPRLAAIIFSFPLVYYAVAGRGYTVFVRYMIPVIPFLCLGAGAAIAAIWVRLGRRRDVIANAAAVALTAVIAAPTALKSVAVDRLFAQADSRVLLNDWVMARATPNATMLATGGIELYVSGQRLPYRVLNWEVDVLGPERVKPDWIVVQDSALYHYNGRPAELEAMLDQYSLEHTIVASDLQYPHVYDHQDAFFLPIDGFAGVTRPGPNFLIYHRRQ